ncbi:MAG: FAD-dependent monooxygenase [Actinomycetia bacterium]|nr:FAD-dependent monooxygenase [Actinomycetes bacterium]
MTAQVLVVGAGPVGLTMAALLTHYGTSVQIIDKRTKADLRSKAVVLHARTLELLDTLNLASEFTEKANLVHTIDFYGGLDDQLLQASTDVIDSPFDFLACLPQSDTEAVLTEFLAQNGVTVQRGTRLESLENQPESVHTTLISNSGEESTVSFDYVIGCDGGHSAVRAAIGQKLIGDFHDDPWLLVDADVTTPFDRDDIYMLGSQAHFLGWFPLSNPRGRIVLELANAKEVPDPDSLTPRSTEQLIKELTGLDLTITNPRWLTIFNIHHGQVPEYRDGRVFLAGDAAHVHSPAGAQGMNTGMQDAFNLAWKISLACAAAAAEGLLDSYQDERHPVGQAVVRQTTSMTKAMKLSNPVTEMVRNFVIKHAGNTELIRRRFLNQLAETSISYPTSPIVKDLPHSKGKAAVSAGDRFPETGPVTVAYDGRGQGWARPPRLSQVGANRSFVAYLFADTLPADLSTLAALQRLGVRVVAVLRNPELANSDQGVANQIDVVVSDKDGRLADVYGSDTVLLVRPDLYIAGSAGVSEAEDLLRILHISLCESD